jgi:hypothetical protein
LVNTTGSQPFWGGILKRHHGDAFFTDARGAVEDDPPMCQVSSCLTSNLHPLRHRTHEPTDAGPLTGKAAGWGLKESPKRKLARQSRACRHRACSRCLVEWNCGFASCPPLLFEPHAPVVSARALCCASGISPMDSSVSQSAPLKLLPAYPGTSSIEDALQTARGRRILWLEILLNSQLDPAPWLHNPAFREAYQTACRWYTHYRRLITHLFRRAPLPSDPGPIDFRDYSTFAEAVYFVFHHH